MKIGHNYPVRFELDLKGLNCNEIGVELIVTENGSREFPKIVESLDFEIEKTEGDICHYKLNYKPVHPGSFNYGVRLYPKNQGLPHRQDCKFVRWL